MLDSIMYVYITYCSNVVSVDVLYNSTAHERYCKGPVPYTDATQQSSRVVISRYMRPGLQQQSVAFCTTDPSGRKS